MLISYYQWLWRIENVSRCLWMCICLCCMLAQRSYQSYAHVPWGMFSLACKMWTTPWTWESSLREDANVINTVRTHHNNLLDTYLPLKWRISVVIVTIIIYVTIKVCFYKRFTLLVDDESKISDLQTIYMPRKIRVHMPYICYFIDNKNVRKCLRTWSAFFNFNHNN